MTEELQLDDIVGLEPTDLSDSQSEYLQENKGYLTDEQSSKFGFTEVDPVADEAKVEEESDEPDEKEEEKSADEDLTKVEVQTKKRIEMDLGADDEDDDMDPEDRARINKQVTRGNKGIIARQQQMEDNQALNNVIDQSPELKPFKGLALRYMKTHPNLVAKDAMAIASFGKQQQIGARKEREASKKAKDTQSGGSTHRTTSTGAKNWADASIEDVEAQIAKAKGQRI